MIAGVGDKRNEDVIAVGGEAAKIFNEINMRLDDHLRGRTEDEIFALVTAGVRKVCPERKIFYKPEET